MRIREGSAPLDIGYYQAAKPSQRMYSIDIAKIEIYSVVRAADGYIASEARVEVEPQALTEGL